MTTNDALPVTQPKPRGAVVRGLWCGIWIVTALPAFLIGFCIGMPYALALDFLGIAADAPEVHMMWKRFCQCRAGVAEDVSVPYPG